MHFAAQGDKPQVLHYLLRWRNLLEGKFLVDQTDLNGYTPLHWASLSGSYQATRYLLACGADANSVSNADGEQVTPLLLAMKSMEEMRDPKIIHKLLLYGADPNYESPITRKSCWTYLSTLEDEDLKA
jgi:inversin